jgi:hypothetical protein
VDTLDADGNVLASNPGSSSWSGDQLLGFSLQAYPRRERKFRIRIHDQGGKYSADFWVANPNPVTNYPTWQALPLPQTQTNGEVTVTLRSLTTVTNWWGCYCNADFKTESEDPAWKDRSHFYQWLSDATGNKGPYLLPTEAAWKLSLQLFRPDKADFPTNQIWTLPLTDVPNDLTWTNLNASNIVDGIPLWVPMMCGGGVLSISNRTQFSMRGPVAQAQYAGVSFSTSGTNTVESFGCSTPFVFLECGEIPSPTELLIRFRDAGGKLLDGEWRSRGDGVGSRESNRKYRHVYQLKDTNCTSVRIEVIVNRPKVFEFLVKPPVN